MTLLNCQHCSAVNSADLPFCRECGHNLVSPEQSERNRQWKRIGLWIGIVAGLLMILAGLLKINNRSKPSVGQLNSPAPSASTFVPVAASTGDITAVQAKDHVGKTVTVCGVVASAKFADRSRRRPTFLNLDEPHPRHIFTAVIRGDDRAKFNSPEVKLKGKKVCVTGKIEDNKGEPEMVLREPGQLKIKE